MWSVWCVDHGEKSWWKHTFAPTLLNSFTPRRCSIDKFQGVIQRRVIAEHHQMLIADLFSKEIKDALFSMDPKKSLGLDGFNPELFQKSWHVVSEDITKFCLLAFNRV